MEQAGFSGMRQAMVRTMLESGFKRLYLERLPAVLDRLAAEPVTSAAVDRRCERMVPSGMLGRIGGRLSATWRPR
jgi:hypothetical protein